MKYETPELTALTPAVSAIQGVFTHKGKKTTTDSQIPSLVNEGLAAYEDWE